MPVSGFSFSHAVHAICARRAGTIDVESVHAMLGLATLPVASPAATDWLSWMGFGRDFGLMAFATCFDLEVRPLHPANAGVALTSSPEFQQHFDASYVPLIETALAADQAVLAWGHWEGHRDLEWGVIHERHTGEAGGYAGDVMSSVDDQFVSDRTQLIRPPTMVYVVDTSHQIADVPVASGLRLMVGNALRGLTDPALAGGGILFGADAVAYWSEQFKRRALADSPGMADFEKQSGFAAALARSYEAGTRFLQGQERALGKDGLLHPTIGLCKDAAELLSGFADWGRFRQVLQSRDEIEAAVGALDRLRALQHAMAGELANLQRQLSPLP